MKHTTIQCGAYTLDFSKKTYLMGILNVTPDSFSDGGQFMDTQAALAQAEAMVKQGADIIDIGAESTRPGHQIISAKEEWSRLESILPLLVAQCPAPISVDTSKAYVAQKALSNGAHIINDVWGLQKDPDMASVIAPYNCPVIIMHNQEHSHYEKDIIEHIKTFLYHSIEIGAKAGISPDRFIIDPGIGFGKTLEQNYEVLYRLDELKSMGLPILLGASRKSMIGKVLNVPASERVYGTIATSVIGVMKGADILRIHDIKENLDAVKIADMAARRMKLG